MKKVLIIAVILEVIKCLFFAATSGYTDLGGTVALIWGLLFIITMLPELILSGGCSPPDGYTIALSLCAGVVWNLPAAAIIWKCLKERIEDAASQPNLN